MGLHARKKNPGSGCPLPGSPDVLEGPVHPFGSLAALNCPPSDSVRAHSFASPPHDGFAFIGDSVGRRFPYLSRALTAARCTVKLGHDFWRCKSKSRIFSDFSTLPVTASEPAAYGSKRRVGQNLGSPERKARDDCIPRFALRARLLTSLASVLRSGRPRFRGAMPAESVGGRSRRRNAKTATLRRRESRKNRPADYSQSSGSRSGLRRCQLR